MDHPWIIHKLLWTLRPERKRNFQSQKATNLKAQKCMIFKAQKLYGVRPQKINESKGPKTYGNDGPLNLWTWRPPKNVNFVNLWILKPKNPRICYFKNLGAKHRQSARASKTMNNHINEPSKTTKYEFENKSKKNVMNKNQCLELCCSKDNHFFFQCDIFHWWKKQKSVFSIFHFDRLTWIFLAVRALSTSLPNMATGHLT